MIRPLSDWLVIKLDERPLQQGLVILVAAAGQERVRTGVVLRAGPGRWSYANPALRELLDVEEGERVAFFRENFETLQGKQVARIVAEIEPGTVMVRARDLLYAWRGKDYLPMLTEELLNTLPEEVTVSGGGLIAKPGASPHELPVLQSTTKSYRKTKPESEGDKAEDRAAVLESDFGKFLLEATS